MALSPQIERFVLHFGEMGSRWGINRTVGQIYALLYVADRPLNADDICDTLGFSRSNVSMGLKELDSWNLIRLRHLPNDRRDHFTTPDDIWEIVRTLVEQRRKREIEPTLTMLRDTLRSTPSSKHLTVSSASAKSIRSFMSSKGSSVPAPYFAARPAHRPARLPSA